MTTKPHTSIERSFANTVDAFMASSRVYLDCTEHLTRSTLAVSRAALEECVAATKAAASGKPAADPAGLPLALGQSLLEKTLALAKDSYETVTAAQLESARLLGYQLAIPAMTFPAPEAWKGAFNLFERSLRDLSAAAVGSFGEAGEAWTSSVAKYRHLNKAA
ncbi:phasin family protein [Aromatoleum evansii]|uniref:Phasin family protein n=1 Tax=Aromatoleum evansii TaxID=59406 RepID=A0ABZ1AGJ2_AROEV|nr:phasin family protein [Aromatoleum evansii]